MLADSEHRQTDLSFQLQFLFRQQSLALHPISKRIIGFLKRDIFTYSDRILIELLFLIIRSSSSFSSLGFELLDRLADNFHEVLLECFLFEDKSVFVPNEVWQFWIPAVLLHTSLEQP